MTFLTPRQRGLALVIGTLAVVSAAVAASGRPGWSLAVLSVLLGLVGALVLDVRGRQQVAARGRRRLEETVAALQVSVGREMTALTAEVRRAADRLSALEGVVRGEAHAAAGRHEETLQRLAALDHEPVTEVQALLQLVPKVPDAPPLPAVGGWALSAGSLLGLWRVVEQDRPATVVECGSGSSTLWLAYATRAAGGAQIVALEHRMLFLNRTRALLAEHGMADAAEIRYAPLTEVRVGEETVRWYDPACVSSSPPARSRAAGRRACARRRAGDEPRAGVARGAELHLPPADRAAFDPHPRRRGQLDRHPAGGFGVPTGPLEPCRRGQGGEVRCALGGAPGRHHPPERGERDREDQGHRDDAEPECGARATLVAPPTHRDGPAAQHGARATGLAPPARRTTSGSGPEPGAGTTVVAPPAHGTTPGSTHARASAEARSASTPGSTAPTGRLTVTSTHSPRRVTVTAASGPARSCATARTTSAGSPIAAARAAARAASAHRS